MNKYIQNFMNDHYLAIDEKFKIDKYNDNFWFDKNGVLTSKTSTSHAGITLMLLDGTLKIEKTPKGPWKPKNYEKFWFIDTWGKVGYDVIYCSRTGDYLYKHTKVFQTQEEAEDYKWFLDKVDEYQKPFEYNKNNYRLDYSYYSEEVGYSCSDWVQIQGAIYFGDKENIDNFIDQVGKDRIEKYMFDIYS